MSLTDYDAVIVPYRPQALTLVAQLAAAMERSDQSIWLHWRRPCPTFLR